MTFETTQRKNWVSALTMVPSNELLELIAELSESWNVRPKSAPQSGLGMLKLKDSAFNEAFYLGELPISSVWLEITTADDQLAEGAAQVMDDSLELAQALALCDAILSARLPGWQRVATMVETGMRQRQKTHEERKRLLAHTKVDFSLLDDVGDENA